MSVMSLKPLITIDNADQVGTSASFDVASAAESLQSLLHRKLLTSFLSISFL